MEKEESSTKLTGWFLTLLFIYFCVIVYSLWDIAMRWLAWGKAYIIMHDVSEWIVPLALTVAALIYGIIAVYQAMKHNRGSVAALRWGVVFMLVIVIGSILKTLPDMKAFIGSASKFVVFLYLLIFLIYLFRAKSIRRMFPKEGRKNTAIVWWAWIIDLAALGWWGYCVYGACHERILASPFEEAGSVKDKTVIIDYATFEIPDGWRVDTIVKVQNLQAASIVGERKWLVFQSQLGHEEDIREHLLNSTRTLGIDDDDFVSQDETASVRINGGDAYVSRFTKKEGRDTVMCAFASLFDSQTKRNATLMLESDSLMSMAELKLLMGKVSFTNPILKNK